MASTETKANLRGRVRGCLLGLAVGDALGTPVRGLKPGRAALLFREGVDHIDAREVWSTRPRRWHLPGLHSAPTQQALTLIEALARVLPTADRAELPQATARAVANLWRRLAFGSGERDLPHGVARGGGETWARALDAMRDRTGPSGQPSAGIGAAASIAPLGWVFRDDAVLLTDVVIEVTLLTHTDPRAVGGALAVAHAAALLLDSEDALRINAAATLGELTARVREGENRLEDNHLKRLHRGARDDEPAPLHAMSRALEALTGLVAEADDALAVATLIRQANHFGPEPPVTSPTFDFAPAAVPVALHLAFAHTRFAGAVEPLVTSGKEANAAAAIAGALAGARLGEDSISQAWRNGLVARKELSAWADSFADLLTGEGAADHRPDLMEMELALTLREREARQPLIEEFEAQRKHQGPPPKARRKPAPTEPENLPFAPPPHTYLKRSSEDPEAKRLERAARGKRRIPWKEERRRDKS